MFSVFQIIMCENENKLDSDIPFQLDEPFHNEHVSNESFEEELKNLPEISNYIQRLQECILRQQKLLHKLFQQLQEQKLQRNVCDAATQTDEHSVDEQWKTEEEAGTSLVEQVKEAAETAMQQTGFVYEATSGMYYDYSTGYYYNAELGLYYDGNSGIYYYYDDSVKEFKFHSQIEIGSATEERHKTSDNEDCAKRKTVDNQETEPKKIKTEADEEIEEGECSSSSDQEDENELTSEGDDNPMEHTNCIHTDNSRLESDLDNELANAWPPCLRVIVKETDVKEMSVGTLFIVTYTGGTIGREGDHSVLIPDISISKHHARFSFSEEKGLYTLVDLGSRNGTFIDGERMSVALRESEPLPLNHGCVIRIGSTQLLCHMHKGWETCTECEPGCTQVSSAYTKNTKCIHFVMKDKGECHRSELLRLRKKFGLDQLSCEETHVGPSKYTDRAEERRKTVGSSCDSFKTEVTSVHESISSENKGFKMLAKMGWTEGQSIGKDTTRSTEPGHVSGDPVLPSSTFAILARWRRLKMGEQDLPKHVPKEKIHLEVLVNAEQKTNTTGLGYETQAAMPPVDVKGKRKTDVWRKTQQRYDNIVQKK